jgi:murein DD-endopeptidase MepM/ murein hydrolase activator NlpD
VADGKIVFALDGLPNQIPGALPPGLKVEQADGNHVIQELAPGQYGLYAHMQPGSVKVKSGDTVKAGQLLGLVGNSGNTSAPHLHFHVMDRPATLASSGLPYLFSNFELMGRTPGTAAFDEAEEKGIPIPIIPEKNDGLHRDEYPLDQSLINFSETVP